MCLSCPALGCIQHKYRNKKRMLNAQKRKGVANCHCSRPRKAGSGSLLIFSVAGLKRYKSLYFSLYFFFLLLFQHDRYRFQSLYSTQNRQRTP